MVSNDYHLRTVQRHNKNLNHSRDQLKNYPYQWGAYQVPWASTDSLLRKQRWRIIIQTIQKYRGGEIVEQFY